MLKFETFNRRQYWRWMGWWLAQLRLRWHSFWVSDRHYLGAQTAQFRMSDLKTQIIRYICYWTTSPPGPLADSQQTYLVFPLTCCHIHYPSPKFSLTLDKPKYSLIPITWEGSGQGPQPAGLFLYTPYWPCLSGYLLLAVRYDSPAPMEPYLPYLC
jgi:hypothetical protein